MATVMSNQDRRVEHFLVGGSTTEAVGGTGALVLAILGLAGVVPHFMLSIAAIALGAAILTEGASVAAQYNRILRNSVDDTVDAAELGGGLSGEAIAGVTSIVLGILALLGLSPVLLSAVAVIVLGAGLMMGTGVNARLNDLKLELSQQHETAKRAAQEAMVGANSAQLLVGGGAVVLGILSIVGIAPMTLGLVAMLAMGASVLLSGGAVTARILTLFSR